MTANIQIRRGTAGEAEEIAVMVGELLEEIMNIIGAQAFRFDLEESVSRLRDFIIRERYFVFVARDEGGFPVGFATLYESYALYAEGVFGTIPEFYVRAEFRSGGIGQLLAEEVKAFGRSRGWTRLEVTTPPLPEFEKTLAFYEREGFTITGGRKLKVTL